LSPILLVAKCEDSLYAIFLREAGLPSHSIILCADDFGFTEGVSRGILELAANSRISATGAMTNCRWWPVFARELAPMHDKVSIGLHLNLTAGAPLGEMSVVAPANAFPSAGKLARMAFSGHLDRNEIIAEIERQITSFERAIGFSPDFIDGHQHIHVLPVVRSALLEVIAARFHETRPWLRDPSDSLTAITRRRACLAKALAVKALALGWRQAAKNSGFQTNEGFSGFSAFSASVAASGIMQAAFTAMGPHHLVMCHPGFVDEELLNLDPATDSRRMEFDYFMSDNFTALLERKKIELVRELK